MRSDTESQKNATFSFENRQLTKFVFTKVLDQGTWCQTFEQKYNERRLVLCSLSWSRNREEEKWVVFTLSNERSQTYVGLYRLMPNLNEN